jgi:pilus assembly protein Flp/PilA
MRTPERREIMFKSATAAICRSLRRFAADTSGATAIEYALIASGISIAIVGTVATLGTNVKGFYSNVATSLK